MDLKTLIQEALKEDLYRLGDITTEFFVPAGAKLRGRIKAKAAGVICGTRVAREVFSTLSPECRIKIDCPDGGKVRPGQTIMEVSGGREILTAERVALNFLQHLSGVATLTAAYVAQARGSKAKIYDTRKTLPGWRELEKYAVRCGGGCNHRMGLYDAVLLKDNHWALGSDIDSGIAQVGQKFPNMTIEIEAANQIQVHRALAAGAHIILLDNMTTPKLREAIRLIRKTSPSTQIEISGGVNFKNVRALAKLGPDRISIGRLTHSAPALDLSLEIE